MLASSLLAGAGLVAIALAWWIADVGVIPRYGDTTEYLSLSQTLRVDQFRTLLYPLLLRMVGNSVGLVYTMQTVVALAAIAYLGSTLWTLSSRLPALRHLARARAWQRRAVIAVFTLLVFCQPLVAHFDLSVLSDSLAASFAIAACAALIRIAALSDTRRRTIALALLATVAAEWIREEKVAVVAIVVAAALIGALARHRDRRVLATLGAVLVLPATAVSLVNHQTQTADLGRPPVDAASRLFNRTVWPHMERILPLLSGEARSAVTMQQARSFDADYNRILPMDRYLRQRAGGTPGILDAMSNAALRCCWRDIAADTGADLARYSVPTVAYAAGVLLPSTPWAAAGSSWTETRMAMAHPSLTRLYELWWVAALVLVQLPLLLALLPRVRRREHAVWAVGIAGALCLVNAALFALTNSIPANVRYSLPAYSLSAAVLLWADLVQLHALLRLRSATARNSARRFDLQRHRGDPRRLVDPAGASAEEGQLDQRVAEA